MQKKISIRTKLATILTILIGVISLFIFFYFPTKLEHQGKKAIAEKAGTISEMISYSISPALVFDDRAGVEEVVRSAWQNRDLEYIAVVDDSGNVASAYFRKGASRTDFLKGTPGNRISADGKVYETVMPIYHENRQIGELYMGMSLSGLQELITRSRTTTAMVSAVIFLAGMIAVFGISTVVTKPLSSMVVTAGRIAQGDLSQRAAVSSHDEVGGLAASFNQMVDSLEVANVELANVNRTLERRIEERTGELLKELSERKRAEQALRESEDRFRRLSEAAFEGIGISDGGVLMDANLRLAQMLGYDIAEMIGKSIMEFVAPESEEMVRKHVMSGSEEPYEHLALRKDGSIFPVEAQGRALPYGSRQVRVTAIRDISEYKTAEKRIREQAALLNVTKDAIVVCNLRHSVLFWNRGAEQLYGWMAEEVLGSIVDDVLRETGADHSRGRAYRQVVQEGEWVGEMKHQAKDGKELVVENRWTLVRDEAEVPKSILMVMTDITEKKQLESQFRRAQRLETIGTLAGGIAHDLNNVLAPIMMAIQLLRKRVDDEKGQEWLDIMEGNANRGSEIVKQVLTFARGVEGERVVLQPKHLFREVEKIASETFPRSIEIASRIPSELWTIAGDATQLHQVLMNLCVNARDAMPQGGKLLLTAENVHLDEKTARLHPEARPGQFVVLSVADTGVGIGPEIIDKIFDPFFTTKDVGKGTGLGLATVQGIVKSHKGFITVTSEPGRGTEFRVYLPASESAVSRAEEEESADMTSGHGELVLVVDDEDSVREMTKEILEASGYRVLTASNGQEAVDIYEQQNHQVDVVVTDLMMPVMDGVVMIRTLQHLEPGVKIIAASGFSNLECVDKASCKSVRAFLPKPFGAEKLLSVLEAVLE